MKRWWIRYLLIGVAAYAVVLIARFPAAVAYPLVQSAIQPLALSGLEGSIWSGRAADVRYQRHVVGSVSWSLRPGSLLSGAVGADLVVDGPYGEAQGVGGVGFSGNGYLQDLNGNLSVAAIAPLLNLQAVRPDGRVELNVARLDLAGRIPVHAEGELIWQPARIAFPQALELGGFSATLSSDAEGIRAALRDRDSPVVLDAVLALKQDGSYRLSGRLAAKNDAPPVLHNLLRGAGVRQQGAALPLNFSGRI